MKSCVFSPISFGPMSALQNLHFWALQCNCLERARSSLVQRITNEKRSSRRVNSSRGPFLPFARNDFQEARFPIPDIRFVCRIQARANLPTNEKNNEKQRDDAEEIGEHSLLHLSLLTLLSSSSRRGFSVPVSKRSLVRSAIKMAVVWHFSLRFWSSFFQQ